VYDPDDDNPLGIVEIKCPISAKDTTLNDLCSHNNQFFLHLDKNKMKLKTNHNYCYQIQEQLHITRRAWCDFYVWTPRPNDVHIERIQYNASLWKQMYSNFYFGSMLPELVRPLYPSRKKIRGTIDI